MQHIAFWLLTLFKLTDRLKPKIKEMRQHTENKNSAKK